jgi:hypothetical protein
LNELSQRAAIPTPRLYVIDSPGANATAAGRDRRHASICVTTGLLHTLTRDELAGVLSHELAHGLQRSALTKTAASTLGAAISLLPLFGLFFGLGIGLSLLLHRIGRRRPRAIGDRPGWRICGRQMRRAPQWPTRRTCCCAQNRVNGRNRLLPCTAFTPLLWFAAKNPSWHSRIQSWTPHGTPPKETAAHRVIHKKMQIRAPWSRRAKALTQCH